MKNLLVSCAVLTHDSAIAAVIAAIRIYQRTISPDHGVIPLLPSASRCKFFPSCSEYTVQALRQYGLLKGAVVSLRRIGKCVPWGECGYDPINTL